jgi:hypothetical protein
MDPNIPGMVILNSWAMNVNIAAHPGPLQAWANSLRQQHHEEGNVWYTGITDIGNGMHRYTEYRCVHA